MYTSDTLDNFYSGNYQDVSCFFILKYLLYILCLSASDGKHKAVPKNVIKDAEDLAKVRCNHHFFRSLFCLTENRIALYFVLQIICNLKNFTKLRVSILEISSIDSILENGLSSYSK